MTTAVAVLVVVVTLSGSAAATAHVHRHGRMHGRAACARHRHRTRARRCRTARTRSHRLPAAGTAGTGYPGPSVAGVQVGPSPTPLTTHCNLVASPSGSDSSGNGSVQRPYASPVKLERSLKPGQTGCLRAGVYGSTTTWHDLSQSGSGGAQITITSYPGELATVVGWIDLEASYVTLSYLRVDGSNTFYNQRRSGTTCHYPVSQGLVIAGHDDVFEFNDYYQSVASLRGNGIGIGWWGNVDNTVIRFNKIHDVGGCDFYDHLIYLAHGNNAQVYGNWMWNDRHGWGVKLDPGPTGARVWGNVIDGAGSGFNFGNSSGTSPTANNQVFDNVVMNSVGVSNPDIGWSYPGVLVTCPGLLPASTGNLVYNNDSFNNPGGISDFARTVTSKQIALTNNINAVPQFVDVANHDYRLG
jgi:hypothetical protein